MLMDIVKQGLCLVVTVVFVVFPILTSQKVPNSSVQSDYDFEYQYIMALQESREKCYERILFLGMVSDRELTMVKHELGAYLEELYAIQRQAEQQEMTNELFYKSILLDEQLMTSTLQAIHLKDERYLENLEEIYLVLQDYHEILRINYMNQFD